jgi:hypothetical protein
MGREPSQIQSPVISAEQRAAEALRTEQLRAILRQTQARTPNIADLKLPEFMGENVPMSDPRLQNVPVIQPGPAEFVGPGASPELSDPMLQNVPVQRPQRPPVLGESPNVRPGPALLEPQGVRPGFPPQRPQLGPGSAMTPSGGGGGAMVPTSPGSPMPPPASPGVGQSLLSILGALGTGMGAVDTKRMLEQGRWQDALAAGLPTGGALAAARGVGGGLARGLSGIPGALLYGLGRSQDIGDGTISGLPEGDTRRSQNPDFPAVQERKALASADQSYGVMAPPGGMLNPDFFGPAPKKPAPRPARRTAPTPAARTSVGEVMPSFDLGGPTMRLPEREPMGLGVPDLQLGKRQVLRPDANESEVSSDDFEQSMMDLELLKQLKRQMGGAVTRPGFSGRGPDNLPFYPR